MSEGDLLYETVNDEEDRRAVVKQEFKLYIKASGIDKETRGSCPICQHWFMIAYLIAENQPGVNFSVFTVQENSPPKEFECWSKKFPVVIATNCTDKKGGPLTGMYDTFDELEKFFEGINRECKQLKRHNEENDEAMGRVDTLYSTFNQFIRGTKETKVQREEKLTNALKKLNKELDNGKTFLIDDMLCYADCHLLPRLQHIRVVGQACGYRIPEECTHIWRYLHEAYKTNAFIHTMPYDRDIKNHYSTKVSGFDSVSYEYATLQGKFQSTDIPESCLNGTEENGEVQQQQEEQENNGMEYQ